MDQTLGPTAEHVLGKRVRELRQARGWSQDDVARQMVAGGFSWRQTTVAKTEKADRPVRVNEATALAQLFETDLDQLVTPNQPPLLKWLDEARQDLRAMEAAVARAQDEVKLRSGARDFTELRVQALEAVIAFWRDPTELTFMSATTAALYTSRGSDWVDLLAEAGVPRAVLEAADGEGLDDRLVTDQRRPGETALDQINRLITTELLHWFESTHGGGDDGEHREAP